VKVKKEHISSAEEDEYDEEGAEYDE